MNLNSKGPNKRMIPLSPFRLNFYWLAPMRLTTQFLILFLCLGFFETSMASGQEVSESLVPTLSDSSSAPGSTQSSVIKMLFGGSQLGNGVVVVLLILSLASVYFIVEHSMTITRQRLIPRGVLDELERLIAHGEVHRAIQLCQSKDSYSLATEVIHAGLDRYQNSEFGFAEYRAAVEEAGEDQTGKLYRRTEALNVISAIAPMLGLLGTVLGMIESFNTIAAKEGMAQPQDLAGGIGEALITTFLGLMVAIPSMVALSYFRNKIDSLVSEAGKRVERIMTPLGRKKSKSP